MARRKQRRTESGRAFGYEEINGIKENYFTPCKARQIRSAVAGMSI